MWVTTLSVSKQLTFGILAMYFHFNRFVKKCNDSHCFPTFWLVGKKKTNIHFKDLIQSGSFISYMHHHADGIIYFSIDVDTFIMK